LDIVSKRLSAVWWPVVKIQSHKYIDRVFRDRERQGKKELRETEVKIQAALFQLAHAARNMVEGYCV
jgi:hypothetical protein